MSDDNSPDHAPEATNRVAPRSPNEAIQPEPAPAPPTASRRARNPVVVALSGVLTFLVLMVIAAGSALYVGVHQFERPGPLNQARTVNIPSGQGTIAIANLLEREGIIDHAWTFVGGVALNKARNDLKAGEYLVPEHASMSEVMALLVEGKAILHRVTFPEGHTSAQIVARLEQDPILTGEIEETPAEGTLLPETYTFTRGTSRQQVIDRMARAQAAALEEIWARRADDLPLETPEELVILASIVEKETARADERPRVASVFINRLERGMRLQSDPTILYGLYGGEAFMEYRTITRSELDAPNDYSTYQIDRLPPTPIANPGRAAMEAVANPSRTEDLYFVADGSGGHAFGTSLDEHNRNVARWREIERERREQAENEPEGEAAGEGEEEGAAASGEGGDTPTTGSLRGMNLNIQ